MTVTVRHGETAIEEPAPDYMAPVSALHKVGGHIYNFFLPKNTNMDYSTRENRARHNRGVEGFENRFRKVYQIGVYRDNIIDYILRFIQIKQLGHILGLWTDHRDGDPEYLGGEGESHSK